MNTKPLFTLLFVISSSDIIYGNQKVNVSVYYETLCPDSVYLIRTQIHPTWSLLKNHLNISYIPFGKAVHNKDESGKWTFDCQHGPKECTGNRIQACGLHVLSDNSSQCAEFVACYMDGRNAQTPNNTCFDRAAEPDHVEKRKKFSDCLTSTTGDDILALYGDLTFNVTPSITNVPTLTFNGAYNSNLQAESERDFRAVVCQMLKEKPKECVDAKSPKLESVTDAP